MAGLGVFGGSSIAILLLATTCVASVPLRGGTNAMQQEDYGSPLAEFASRYSQEDRGIGEPRDLDIVEGGRSTGYHRYGSAFGDGKARFLPSYRRASWFAGRPGNLDENERFAKRNIDEIDRTAFDSFFKRNLDEIDRVGWSGFVKRFEDYMEDRQRV